MGCRKKGSIGKPFTGTPVKEGVVESAGTGLLGPSTLGGRGGRSHTCTSHKTYNYICNIYYMCLYLLGIVFYIHNQP